MRVAMPELLDQAARRHLEQHRRERSIDARDVLRSLIVLLASQGHTRQQISRGSHRHSSYDCIVERTLSGTRDQRPREGRAEPRCTPSISSGAKQRPCWQEPSKRRKPARAIILERLTPLKASLNKRRSACNTTLRSWMECDTSRSVRYTIKESESTTWTTRADSTGYSRREIL